MSGLAGLAVVAKARSIAGSVPRWVWISVAAGLLIIGGIIWHSSAKDKALDAAYARGKADEAARIEKKAIELAAKAKSIADTLRSMNNVENRRIAGDADAIRLQGPGKAACLNPATPGPGRREPSSGAANAAVDQVPSGEGLELIGLPFADLVAAAERCDLNRAEAMTWREDKRLQIEAWKKAQ